MFLNAHRCLEDGVEPYSERAWLFKIAEHVVMHRWRTISRRARVEFPVDVDAIADLVVAPEQESAELRGLPDALARLPTAQQRAIVLREWYGLSYREVAKELGLTVSATETLIFRARCRLAQELGGPAPTARRRTPLSLAWLVGSGGPAVKAIVGVTSVAVLAVAGSARIGLLPHSGSHPVTPVVPRAVAPATVKVSQRFVPARRRVSTTHVAAKRRTVEEPVAATSATGSGHPAVPEQEALPQEAAPVVVDVPSAGEPVVGSVSAPAPDPSVADAPPPTADPPGQSGDVHGPNENAAAGQAQREDSANGNANPTPGVPPVGRGQGDNALAVAS